ncbi:hypothetical protein [Moritella sp. F3]|uniref:hypothetical protein n=1 Tax=Moritella sp. F3 TaxID=2718882 RepID=UPI0018E0FECC|nr:hypothetical protein [Moritella sp. F3]GIC77600.1 hypothetical protein FMO001_23270 [Moritella sp. F1]GIC82013.1 hypothetical protein FMO003_22940 [Moritella sp. F3]
MGFLILVIALVIFIVGVGRVLKLISFIYFGLIRLRKGDNYYPATPFGFKGKLVYSDENINAKIFRSSKYLVQAKPDFIYETAYQKFTLVEYKERNAKVYLSDEIQMLTSVIAVRDSFNITHGYVVTGKEKKGGVLPDSATIYGQVKPYIIEARKINKCGKTSKSSPAKFKCLTCAMRSSCEFKIS